MRGVAPATPRIEKGRFLNLGTVAFVVPSEMLPPGPYQNCLVVAVLLLSVGIVPSRGTRPPRSWQAFYEEKAGRRPT